MAEKEISNIIKLQIEAGKASPAPPVGPALGSSGVNIMQFVKEFNDRTANQPGMIIPVVITVYKDKSFEFITKVPPVAVLIKKAAKIQKGSHKGANELVATITKDDLKKIAETKLPDLNAYDVEAAMNTIEGTARNMGVAIKGVNDAEMAEQAAEAAKEEAEQAKRDAELAEMEAEAKAEVDVNVEVIGENKEESEEKTEE